MTTFTTNFAPNAFARALNAVKTGFAAHARRMSRRDQIEALEARSDAELAALGITRSEIGRYVFRDLFYA